MTSSGEKKSFVTVLNVISCIAVVMLHTNGCFWEFSRTGHWPSANVLECLMYFGVPVFFMLSGATLMDYRERYSTKTFFLRRGRRTLVPFLLWSLVGIGGKVLIGRLELGELTPGRVVEMIFNAQAVETFWFFIPLFSVYLCLPVLSAVTVRRREVFTYLVVVCLSLNVLCPFACSLLGLRYNGALAVMDGYLVYAVLGYLLSQYELGRRWRILIYVLGAAGLLLHMAGTYFLSMRSGAISHVFKGYLNLPCFFYAAAVFLLVRQGSQRWKPTAWWLRIAQWLSGYTFSVYLLHSFVLWAVKRCLSVNECALSYRVGGAFAVVLLCVLIAHIGRKVPVVKYFFP